MSASNADPRPATDDRPSSHQLPATHPPTGRRERKKSETRQALRTAAIRLVGERGFDAVTVEDITEAADVSRRTFFNYYGSKEQALTAADPDRLSRLRAALAARPASEAPLDALRAVLSVDTAELSGRRSEWLQQLAVINTDPRLLAALAASWYQLEQELAAGLVDRLDADHADTADVLAATAVAVLRVATRRWKQNSTEPFNAVIRAAFDALTGVSPTRSGTRPTKTR